MRKVKDDNGVKMHSLSKEKVGMVQKHLDIFDKT